ncbi:FGGY-family carbohydrate kinase [Saccharopolyspora sp. K220]|uniref:FGGY family carbohydrate kinase n=1 Tax=Saccharopolyspora soli TaxID=2926618 RepID=UPI001F5AA835|nr:FGGY family carbohydrate kinase [Saccharopolyspora soli]MCI2419518.1 FGGY-family carbohydrate kinase [Saccharopolyspora soli]
MTAVIIGVDVGTTSVKVAAFSPQGQLIRVERTGIAVSRPRSGWAEQDALDWWRGCVRGIEAVISDLPGVQVRSIGVVGQVNTHLFVDEHLQPLAPAILWQDQRCREIAIEQDAGFTVDEKIRAWGRPMTFDASFAPARAAWFDRNQPEKWQRTRWMLGPKDFVVAKLTGKIATDQLSVVRLTNRDGNSYVPQAVGLVDGLADRLPPIHDLTAPLGEVTDTTVTTGAATVSAGATDSVGDIVGSGSAVPGRAMVSCGTSLVVAGVSSGPAQSSRILSLPPLWGAHVHAGPTRAAGDALRWWSQVRGDSIEAVLREAQHVEAGSSGVVFTPHLMGQRAPLWDSEVRGSFLGLSSATSGAEMSRAVLEGVAMSARQVLDAVESAVGWEFDSLAFVGGGARSDLWAQIHADVLGRPIRRLRVSDAAGFGAALLGAVSAGVYPDIETATTAVRVERVFTPHETAHSRLQPLYAVYQEVYRALEEAHRQLADWRDRPAAPPSA